MHDREVCGSKREGGGHGLCSQHFTVAGDSEVDKCVVRWTFIKKQFGGSKNLSKVASGFMFTPSGPSLKTKVSKLNNTHRLNMPQIKIG